MKKDNNEMDEQQDKKGKVRKFPFAKAKEEKLVLEPMDEESEEERRQEKNKRMLQLKKRIFLIIGAVFVVLLLYIIITNSNYNSYEVVEETSVTNASMVDYIPYQDSLLKFSRDGAVYVNDKGASVWNESYAMKMPAADVSGEYAAVADMNGNDVYIFNKEGKVSNSTMPFAIKDVAVASQGEFAVILEGEKENYINIYDRNGEQISEIQTTIDKSGYPMDIDLSDDGEKLFSSYLYLDGADVKNGLAAYNFGSVGQNENADRLMGGYQLDDTIVPKVEFLNNNTICAFGDNQFIIYSMKEKPSEKAIISFKGEVQSVVYNSNYIGIVVANTEKTKGDEEVAPYELQLYNLTGRKVMTKKIDFDYENVRMSEEEIVFTGGNECRIYTIKGKLKFSYAFKKSVVDMVPTGSSRRYIILYDSGSEVIKLKHESTKE